MRRSTRTLIALLSAAASIWPPVASAQSVDAALHTPKQVRDQFAHAGLVVGEQITWSTSGVTSFLVTDASDRVQPGDRVVMVLVYPEFSVAESDRQNSEYPVLGYGRAEWSGNVAVVQSTQRQLSEIFMQHDMGIVSIDANASDAFARQRAELPPVDADVKLALVGFTADL